MKKVRLFVYDFDGTLVDTKLDVADSVNHALKELGVRQLHRETIFGYVGDGVGPLLARSLAGTDFADVLAAVEVFKKHYDKHLLDRTDFYPRCRETIDYFSNKLHAILSNKPVYFINRILDELNFAHPFTSVLGGDSVERKKPDPQGLLQIIRMAQVAPDEVLMVGDSGIDVETGRRANVSTCAVTYGIGGLESISQFGPDWIIHDFSELKNLFC